MIQITPRRLQIGAAIACLFLHATSVVTLQASAAGDGPLLGPMLLVADAGLLFLVLGLVLSFFHRRGSLTLMIAATMLSLPLYLCFIFPYFAHLVSPEEYGLPFDRLFDFNLWNLIIMLSFALLIATWTSAEK